MTGQRRGECLVFFGEQSFLQPRDDALHVAGEKGLAIEPKTGKDL